MNTPDVVLCCGWEWSEAKAQSQTVCLTISTSMIQLRNFLSIKPCPHFHPLKHCGKCGPTSTFSADLNISWYLLQPQVSVEKHFESARNDIFTLTNHKKELLICFYRKCIWSVGCGSLLCLCQRAFLSLTCEDSLLQHNKSSFTCALAWTDWSGGHVGMLKAVCLSGSWKHITLLW